MPRLNSVLSAKKRLILVAAAVSPMIASTRPVNDAVTIPSVKV